MNPRQEEKKDLAEPPPLKRTPQNFSSARLKFDRVLLWPDIAKNHSYTPAWWAHSPPYLGSPIVV